MKSTINFGIYVLLSTVVMFACAKDTDTSGTRNPPGGGGPGNNQGNNPGVAKNLFQADPAIFEEDGTFYLYGTNDEAPDNGFQVYKSTDLKNWKGPDGYRNGYALSKIENFGNRGFWAPQVFKANDQYLMIYTAEEHIAISTSTSLTGPFSQPIQKRVFGGTRKQIDPFVYVNEDEKKYLFYVDIRNGNKIFMTELHEDFMVKDDEGIECLRTTERWENTGQPSANVIEGPTVIKHRDYYYLLYSANHFENPNYAVGYATSKDIRGPWAKYAGNPVISRHQVGWAGSGHGDLITTASGKPYQDDEGHLYYVFHTHNTKESSKKVPRKTAIVELKWKQAESGPDILEIVSGSFRHLTLDK